MTRGRAHVRVRARRLGAKPAWMANRRSLDRCKAEAERGHAESAAQADPDRRRPAVAAPGRLAALMRALPAAEARRRRPEGAAHPARSWKPSSGGASAASAPLTSTGMASYCAAAAAGAVGAQGSAVIGPGHDPPGRGCCELPGRVSWAGFQDEKRMADKGCTERQHMRAKRYANSSSGCC